MLNLTNQFRNVVNKYIETKKITHEEIVKMCDTTLEMTDIVRGEDLPLVSKATAFLVLVSKYNNSNPNDIEIINGLKLVYNTEVVPALNNLEAKYCVRSLA